MNKLEELKALLEAATPGPFHISNGNEGSSPEYGPLWEIQNHAMLTDNDEDESPPFSATLHYGRKEDLELFIAMRELILPLIAVAEAAQDIISKNDLHWSDTIEHRIEREKALKAALLPLTKEADK